MRTGLSTVTVALASVQSLPSSAKASTANVPNESPTSHDHFLGTVHRNDAVEENFGELGTRWLWRARRRRGFRAQIQDFSCAKPLHHLTARVIGYPLLIVFEHHILFGKGHHHVVHLVLNGPEDAMGVNETLFHPFGGIGDRALHRCSEAGRWFVGSGQTSIPYGEKNGNGSRAPFGRKLHPHLCTRAKRLRDGQAELEPRRTQCGGIAFEGSARNDTAGDHSA